MTVGLSAIPVVIILKTVPKLVIIDNGINDICYQGLCLLCGIVFCVSDGVVRVPGVNCRKRISVCVG
jgi:hypothetical protein